jgi:hypothetical protein
MSQYIDDPIVIRKARGALIVSSSIPTDPIQLIRQLSHNELEVHLKNGHRYVENIGDADMQQIIMEMMGYAPHEVTMTFSAWPDNREGGLKFLSGKKLQDAGLNACAKVFSPTPYMNSKFLKVEIDHSKEQRISYGIEYLMYYVTAKFTLFCRVDMVNEVANQFYEQGFHYIVKTFFDQPRCVSACDVTAKARVLE